MIDNSLCKSGQWNQAAIDRDEQFLHDINENWIKVFAQKADKELADCIIGLTNVENLCDQFRFWWSLEAGDVWDDVAAQAAPLTPELIFVVECYYAVTYRMENDQRFRNGFPRNVRYQGEKINISDSAILDTLNQWNAAGKPTDLGF